MTHQHRNQAKHEADNHSMRLAVLIDADNAQAAVIEGLLTEVAGLGEAVVKRIYGDFTSPHSAAWKKVLQRHAIKPVQQFAYTTGKNATDSTLIIDAMDLLYTRSFDGFCLVTSDSDFTGLAMRIREEGLQVIGFGESKTPEAFRNACHRFVLTEILRPGNDLVPPAAAAESEAPSVPATKPIVVDQVVPKPEVPKQFLLTALEQTSDDAGWAHLGAFGGYLSKLQPDFDSRLYGFKKLSDLVRSMSDVLELEDRPPSGPGLKQLYVRAKRG